jgi:putative sigma-54 modulation protein
MQITVTGRHMGVTEALKEYCIEKADRLPRFLDRIHLIEVVLDGKDGKHTAEMIVHAAGAHDPFVAHQQGDDAFAAVDMLMDKIEEQLRRYKERHRNRKHPPRSSHEGPPE